MENALGELTLPDGCSHPHLNDSIEEIDIVHFWACVIFTRNAAGQTSFDKIAERALRVLTLPISNATIERIFSLLAHIKGKRQNRLQLRLLDALLRLRVHLKVSIEATFSVVYSNSRGFFSFFFFTDQFDRQVDGKCCTQFSATKDILIRFNSSMYQHTAVSEPTTSLTGVPEPKMVDEFAGGSGRNTPDSVENESDQLEDEDYTNLAELFDTLDDSANFAHFVTVISD